MNSFLVRASVVTGNPVAVGSGVLLPEIMHVQAHSRIGRAYRGIDD